MTKNKRRDYLCATLTSADILTFPILSTRRSRTIPGARRSPFATVAAVIARVANMEPHHKGIFTKKDHFITVIAATKDEVCILDPSWTSKKFTKWEKEGLVRLDGTLVYTTPEILHNERNTAVPSYYIFRRKKGF